LCQEREFFYGTVTTTLPKKREFQRMKFIGTVPFFNGLLRNQRARTRKDHRLLQCLPANSRENSMKALITGSCGLVGFATTRRLLSCGWSVAGIDNDARAQYFGVQASTSDMASQLGKDKKYTHHDTDIRDKDRVAAAFGNGVDLVVHTAAQPSHDWATAHIREDFEINAGGTLNMLEAWRASCPKAPFVHISTSKVYGDNPNKLPFCEYPTRFDLPPEHALFQGIPESFPLDECLHSFFGVSKLSGDILAQEYGTHFGLPVAVFRPGCVTGGHHRGVELHGFLSYMMHCVKSGKPYRILGHKGKQVRCNVHADDLVDAILLFAQRPRAGAVFNIGGRDIACSLSEALAECENRCGRKAVTEYTSQARSGDHIWWISDSNRLSRELDWHPKKTLQMIFDELHETAV
jgi:CDP-paratose 2-epimerase